MDIDTTETPPERRSILIVAEHRLGHGSGHLHRCARLARELDGTVDWLLPEHPSQDHHDRATVRKLLGEPDLPVSWVDKPRGPYDLVVLDRRSATVKDLEELQVAGLAVGIDLAGEAREYCHYTVDTLQTPPGSPRANVSDPGLLHLPLRVRSEWPEELKSILVVFGGETVPGSAVERADELAQRSGRRVTVVAEPDHQLPETLNRLTARGDLAEHLAQFDLVVTHYGLTAFEALWARVPVVLWNPSAYHQQLSRHAGFPTVASADDLLRRLEQFDEVKSAAERLRPAGSSSLAGLLNDLELPERTGPPIGGTPWHPAIERFGERTFYRHRDTGLVFMHRFRPATIAYDHDYFFDAYREQYGRTYLEDFQHIEAMGNRRMRMILSGLTIRRRRVTHRESVPHLLDVGCAYGPFLSSAVSAGCSVMGVDVSSEAVSYVQSTLGFPAVHGNILTMDLDELAPPFDVVTMWYVIEHFSALDELLRRVRRLLRPGGLFAFSTPNASGISGKRNQREFLRQSPEDHFAVFDPTSVRAVLADFGFEVKGIRTTGHHPERFGLPLGKRAAVHRGWRYQVVKGLSQVLQLGDTFEVLAERRS